MDRSSRLNERKIIDLYFQGYSRDTIAETVGVAPSTVSEVIKILPESLIHLRKLSVELRKRDLSVFEAKKGTELRARLDGLGVEFEELQSFAESAEKMRTNPDYEPTKLVQSAMRLSDLEEESGKTYSEAIVDFETRISNIVKQEQKEREMGQRIRKLKAEEKQELARNKVTKKEIAYVTHLRRNLEDWDIPLSDVSDLRKYLQNMQETGKDPRRFVEYTDKHGSFEKSIVFLEQKENQKKLNVQRLEEKEQNLNAAIGVARSTKSELDRQVLEKQGKLSSLQEEKRQTELKEEQEVARLSVLLLVGAEAEKVVDALGTKQKELERLRTDILQEQNHFQDLRQHLQELENRIKALEREIKEKMEIDNYVTQLKTGIAALENRKLALEKEAGEKEARIAAADTITNFLLRSPYDFGQFCLHVEMLKTMKSEPSQPALYVTITEEKIRDIALKAFAGHLMTKEEQTELLIAQERQNEETAKQNAKIKELEGALEATSKRLDCANVTVRVLEAVKTNFEGKCATMGELRDRVCAVYDEEIERSANEKLGPLAVGVAKAVGYLQRMVNRKDNSPVVGGQT